MKKKSFFLLIICFFSYFATSTSFTIAVIPDTQGYTYWRNQKEAMCAINFSEIYNRQIDYIVKNSIAFGGNIIFATHLGDNVESRDRTDEWLLADHAMSRLDGILPFCVVPGNHDYDTWTFNEEKKRNIINGLENFNQYFGCSSKHFKNRSWYGGSFNGGADSYQIFEFENNKFLHIGLEIEPSDAVLDWAQSVINEHKNLPTIITTHQYLMYSYDFVSPGLAAFHLGCSRYGYERNSSVEIWEKFISKNNQIFLVLCGHFFYEDIGEGVRFDINEFGNKVYSLLSDYQGRKEIYQFNKELASRNGKRKQRGCGDGWIRLLQFDLENQKIKVVTYSTEMDKKEMDPDSNFTIKFDFDWNKRFAKESN